MSFFFIYNPDSQQQRMKLNKLMALYCIKVNAHNTFSVFKHM